MIDGWKMNDGLMDGWMMNKRWMDGCKMDEWMDFGFRVSFYWLK
jgi:hypothetical protein